ncbi:ABC transporter permease [soil metagenome]
MTGPEQQRSNGRHRSRLDAGAVRLMAGREVRASLQKRSFWIGASITFAIVLAVAILPGLLGGSDTTDRSVGLVADSRGLRGPLEAIDRADPDLRLRIRSYDSASSAQRAARDGTVDASVVGDRIYVEDDAPDALVAILDQSARVARVEAGVADGSVEPGIARELASPRVLTVKALDPTDSAQSARQAMTVFGIFLLFAQVFSFGYAVSGGIVEEKSSRVVEVLLAKLRPGELLAGKILGIWLLTSAQMLVFAAVGLGASTLSGTLDLPPGWPGVVASLLLWYVVAYLFYACLFAICGALAASPEELQSTSTPATIVLMVGYGTAFAAISDPDGAVARVASFFPSTAPLVMPIRSAMGSASVWEAGLAIVITLATGALLVPVAGRIYRGSVLQTRQTKLRAAWRSARD